MPENKNTEYKREYIDDIRKTIIAFANTDGGTLYIGINDDGTVCGVADTDDTMLRVTNMLRDAIKPDVSMFVDVDVRTMEEKPVVAVTVQRGTARPYYIAGKYQTGGSIYPSGCVKCSCNRNGNTRYDPRDRRRSL